MEDSKTNIVTNNAARRVLTQLKSPLLYLASELPTNPPSQASIMARRISREVEKLSDCRFSLANGQNLHGYDADAIRYTKLRMVDHRCSQYVWLSLAQLQALGPNRACCHCFEPQNLDHIGGKAEIQKFVLQRSLQKTYFSHQNNVGDISDVYEFICITCKSLTYDAPFTWFLRDSPGTNACPCCQNRLQQGR